jgi:hypothetical protein
VQFCQVARELTAADNCILLIGFVDVPGFAYHRDEHESGVPRSGLHYLAVERSSLVMVTSASLQHAKRNNPMFDPRPRLPIELTVLDDASHSPLINVLLLRPYRTGLVRQPIQAVIHKGRVVTAYIQNIDHS